MKEKWHPELAVWQTRRLEARQAVYLWVDGIYVKAGLEKDKAALLVALARHPGASSIATLLV